MTDYRMDRTLTLGPVTLTVADLARSVRYYTQVAGFRLLDRQPQRAQLGVEGQVLVDLHEVAGAVAPPPSSPGLSHFAPLVPARADVARFTQRHLDAGLDVDPRDHVVSQSCYVTDPDGHTIEVTWACPQERWQWTDESLPIVVSTSIAVQDLLDEPGASTPAPLPAGTQMGHVQLKATDAALTRTTPFYRDLLGLEIYARLGDGFIGVGVSDYRSLLVLTDRFSPHGGTPAGPDTTRLTCVDMRLTDPEAIEALAERLTAADHPHQRAGTHLTTHDPSGNPLRFSVLSAAKPAPKTDA
ncbi:VOC family protein [Streptomyces sp. ICBB 8177]|uniref:VOC family protein n=1 Tax=Streptomyces sp. ICBB 8177 TaxID=563922 RepID=UPI000D673572|nr:VOC family protein [Streptomyces sp. ICBB 8177]PWI41466.1 glyoxalase [Streptomyces sp. ICBB 8177]